MLDQPLAVTTEPTDAQPAEPTAPVAVDTAPAPVLVEADLLVEDVSIDGMCGVY
jgi:mycofactocin precursor